MIISNEELIKQLDSQGSARKKIQIQIFEEIFTVKNSLLLRIINHTKKCSCEFCGVGPTEWFVTKNYDFRISNLPYPFLKQIQKNANAILTADHIIPLSKEGKKFQLNNLQILCHKCNQRKANKLPSEIILGRNWMKKLNLSVEDKFNE